MIQLGHTTKEEWFASLGLRRDRLSCLHMNVQSVNSKLTELESFFADADKHWDVIMLTETWYSNDVAIFQLPQKRTYYLNRTSRRGGGVSLLINDSMSCELLKEFSASTDDYEVLCAETRDIIFAVCYRPPDGALNVFLTFLENMLACASYRRQNVIIGGDFNIDMNSDSARKKDFERVFLSNGCTNAIESFTRITETTQTTLDLFLTSYDPSCMISGVLSCPISDHMPVCLSVRTTPLEKEKSNTNVTFQLINEKTLSEFQKELKDTCWDEVFQQGDANIAYNIFLSIFVAAYKKHFINKERKFNKKFRKPWLTKELLRKIKKRERLYLTFIKKRIPSDLETFKVYRNKLTKELRNAKEAYYMNLFSSCAGDTDKLWSKLSVVMKRKQNVETIERISLNGRVLTGVELVNAFNHYFVHREPELCSNESCSYSLSGNESSIFLHATDSVEVCSTFLGLKNSCSRDADGIQIRPVKYVINEIVHVLVHIYNLCISTGTFPDKMKVAKVTALYKKGDRLDIKNYRPISILPIFSKCLEKVILNQISSFCAKYQLITKAQYGFQKNKSVELALLEQKEYILQNFEQKLLTLGIFVDFTQAFDHIDHNILVKKLERYGIRGLPLEFIKSYLGRRRQFVFLNGLTSKSKEIISGVPQGSILGPLLFNLYVNDIVHICQQAKFIIYADDTSIFLSSSSYAEITNMANDVLRKLSSWSKQNRLKVNSNKTKAVFFYTRGTPIPLHHNIAFNHTNIEVLDTIKVLGTYFSSNMQWDEHVNFVLVKLSQIAGILNRNRYILPESVKLLIYNTLFVSHINYCHLVWGTTTESNLHKLHLMQKRMIRVIANVSYTEHTDYLFKKYNIPKVHDIYRRRLMRDFYYSIRKNTSTLLEIGNLEKRQPSHKTRTPEPWIVPRSRTNYGDQMLKNTLPRLLNSFEEAGTDISSITPSELRYLLCSFSDTGALRTA